MKTVLRHNLQNFTRALDKEILYAAEDLSWSDVPEEAIVFGEWGIRVMQTLSEQPGMLPYCRGFYRDVYKAILHADLRVDDYESAVRHLCELKKGMQYHYECYQSILESEAEQQKYPDRQLRNMRAYTQKYIEDRQREILERLREWHGEEKYQRLLVAM